MAVLDLSGDAAEATARDTGGLAFSADVADESSVKAALEETISQIGIPRVVVSCAGIAPASRILGREGPHELEYFQDVINTNLVGTFNVLRLCAFRMAELYRKRQPAVAE